MKLLINKVCWAGVLSIILLMAGCRTTAETRPSAITVTQIREMSQSGAPAQEIIDKIHKSGTIYRIKASELARLREQGVPDEVIDYMEQTHLEATRQEQYFRDWSYGADGYWYGGYPFGWPYWDVVVVRERDHRRFEGKHMGSKHCP